jgi:hypothetical protein
MISERRKDATLPQRRRHSGYRLFDRFPGTGAEIRRGRRPANHRSTVYVKTVIPFHFSPRYNGREAELRDEVAAAFARTGARR